MQISHLIGFGQPYKGLKTLSGFAKSLNHNSVDWNNFNFRVLIPRSQVTSPPSGVENLKARVRFYASTGQGCTISGASIARKATAPSTTNPVRLKFSGANGVTIAANGNAWSDFMDYEDDGVSDFIVSVYATNPGSGDDFGALNGGGAAGNLTWNRNTGAVDETMNTNAASYNASAGGGAYLLGAFGIEFQYFSPY